MSLQSVKDQFKDAFIHSLPIIVAFFAPALYVIMLVFLFVMVDTYLGVKAARSLGKKITSNRFSDVFAKLIGYCVFLTVGLLVGYATGWEYAVWLSAIIPIQTEVISIDENQRALGKKGILKQAEDAYKFALKIKHKRDELR